MSTEIMAEVPKELLKYKNKKGFIEVFTRARNGQISEVIRIIPDRLGKTNNGDQLVSKMLAVASKTNKGLADVRKEMNLLNNGVEALTSITKDMASQVNGLFSMTKSVKALSYLNIGMSLTNIAVDVVGFAIIAAKLNDINRELQMKIDKLSDAVLNEKIARCKDLTMSFIIICEAMEDGKNVELSELEKLIQGMSTFVSEMILDLQKDTFGEEEMLSIINTIMPEYTILFCEYLDRYYFENKKIPAIYNMWIGLYDELVNSNFRQRLTDYYFFKEKMHDLDVIDVVNAQMLLVLNGRVQVEDQVEILKTLETREAVEEFRKNVADAAMKEAEGMVPEMAKILNVSEHECREALLKGA